MLIIYQISEFETGLRYEFPHPLVGRVQMVMMQNIDPRLTGT
jgi:hypothetical protein